MMSVLTNGVVMIQLAFSLLVSGLLTLCQITTKKLEKGKKFHGGLVKIKITQWIVWIAFLDEILFPIAKIPFTLSGTLILLLATFVGLGVLTVATILGRTFNELENPSKFEIFSKQLVEFELSVVEVFNEKLFDLNEK